MVWIIPAAITASAAIVFAIFGFNALSNPRSAPELSPSEHTPYPITRNSLIPLIAILFVAAIFSFYKLGSTDVPSSTAEFTAGEPVIIEFETLPNNLDRILWYAAIDTGTRYHVGEYTVTYSANGKIWIPLCEWTQDYVSLFKWHESDFLPPEDTKFLKIESTRTGLELGEVVFLDGNGNRIAVKSSNPALSDEPLIPAVLNDWMYNSYFDEVYHPRTALEHLRGITPYEVTHPPLGKIIMSLGIKALGTNPLGWRIIGVIIGLLTIIPLYIFIHNLFGKTIVSASATALYAFDFMRYVQTRLATVDTEAVLFILLMYYFMYRALSEPSDAPLKRTFKWLALSGLSFGLGAATKWIVIYGGLGLIVLWLILALKIAKSAKSRRENASEKIAGLIGCSVIFFIVIPGVIYLLSYIPYAVAKYGASADGTLSGFLKMTANNQKYMLTYHAGLDSTHPYSSEWWQWILNLRPILYYRFYFDNGTVSEFGALASPLVAWAGLLSLVLMLVYGLRTKSGSVIALGYFSQLLPWIIVPRITFAYHYFPNIVFLVLAIAWLMDKLADGRKRSKLIIGGFTALGVALFLLFFPVLSGLPVSGGYTNWLSWFGSYPF